LETTNATAAATSTAIAATFAGQIGNFVQQYTLAIVNGHFTHWFALGGQAKGG